MSESMNNPVEIEHKDLLLATGALQVTIEIGVAKGFPMNDEKLSLSRLKAALSIQV